MLNAIIRFSIQHKLIIGLFILGWVAWGVIETSRLPIDALPDITSNQVQVITQTPTLAAPEVERLITFPIEQVMSNVPGLVELRSISRFGLSLVTLVFKDDVDLYRSRQMVAERLAQLGDAIPKDIGQPEMAPVTTGLGEVYQYVVRPKKGYEGKYSLADLRSIQDWTIRRQLLGTEGVADVSSFGGDLKQYEVAVDPAKLNSMGVSIADVFSALNANNQNSGGSYIEKGPSVLYIRTEGLATTLGEIGAIPVKRTTSGAPLYIRDIAEVRLGRALKYGTMTFGTQGEVSGAVVMMLKGENGSRVIGRIKEKMDQIRKILPEGIEVEPFLDRSKMVSRAIGTVEKNLVEGALIVIFVLVLFLGNLRGGLVVASVIPLAMLFAVIMMNMFGVSGNLMSLGALDFGLIVDGAVIIVEAVMHRIYHGHILQRQVELSRAQMDEAVEDSASRMMNAAVFGQIIILIVYLPILSLSGIEGKMFRPMAQTVAFALAGAFILSITYVPMMTALVMTRKLRHKENFSDRMIGVLQKIYEKTLVKVLAYPKTIMSVALLLLALSILVASRLGGEFIPELEEGDFAVESRMTTGGSLTHSITTANRAAAVLQTFPEVLKVVCRIGSSEIPTDPMPIDMMDIIVVLREKKEWTTASTVDELANKMSNALSVIPDLQVGFQYPVQMRFNELIAGARQDVVCKIFGEDLDTLAHYASALSGIVGSVDGAKDIYVESIVGLPQVVVKYKRDMLASYGLTIADVNHLVRAAFAGDVAGKIYENERRYDLVVRLADSFRKDYVNIQELTIPTPSGKQIPLDQVADVVVQDGPNQIQREDAKRRVIVGFNTRGRDVQSVVNELQAKAEKSLKLPAGYYIKYGGQFENLMEAKKRLSIAVPIALGLIFLMLYFAFGSVKYGLLVFSAIPLSAIGGILLLQARGMPFSISAGVGFIALFGVAVLNGIVLISEFNRLKKTEDMSIRDIILVGTRVRLRPVLMTAAVASLGFLPMAVSQGAGAEVQRPLATVVIGGLVTATLLTLLVLPVLYLWFEHRTVKKNILRSTAVVLLLLFFGMDGKAQEPAGQQVLLDTLIAKLHRDNLGLQALGKTAEYWKTLQERTFELPPTQIGAEYGNINSVNNDNRFSIGQTFYMPSVYSRQRDYYRAGEEAGKATRSLRGHELERELRLSYFLLQELMERRVMLVQLDTIYARYAHAAELRYKTGESNLLEKTNASLLLGQLQVQRKQLEADIRIQQHRLGALLNTGVLYLPVEDSGPPATASPMSDTASLGGHPLLGYYKGQLALTQAQSALDRSRLTPTIGVGYSNLSMVGWQSPDGVNQKYYGSGQRFQTFNLTLGIPLLNGAVRSKLKAGALSGQAVDLQAASARTQLSSMLLQSEEEKNKAEELLRYYREQGLPQADLIMKQARIAYEKGELSYTDRNALMNQAVQIRLSYLDAMHAWHLAVTEHIYLTGK